MSSGVIFLDMGSIAESRLAGFPGMLGKRCKIVIAKYHRVEGLYDTCCESMHCVTDCGRFHTGLYKPVADSGGPRGPGPPFLKD